MSIFPTPGNPNVNATASDQWLIGEPNYNYIGYSGALDNTVSYQLATGPVIASLANPSINTGAAAGDTYSNIQNLTGSPDGGALYGNNSGQTEQLWALGGTTSLFGGSGYTTFIASSGPTYLYGQASGGDNLADYEVATSGVTVDLANPSLNAGWAAGDTYSNVHDIAGAPYDSTLIADNNKTANLLGNDGNNTLIAGNGNDTLNGGPGSNILIGGPGTDWFVFGGSAIAPGDISMDPLSVLYNAEAGFYSTIYNFDQGWGFYTLNQDDRIDVSKLVSALNDGSQPVTSLVEVIEDASGTFAWLEFNGPSGWTTLAKIEGLQAGDTVGVILNESNPTGFSELVQSAAPGNATNAAEWVLSNGSFSKSLYPGSVPGGDWQAIATGDFTNNGTDDILWYNSGSGDVADWQLANGQWSASVDFGILPADWQVEGTGNFFGSSNDTDILLYNAGDSQADILKVSNGQWAADLDLGTLPTSEAGWKAAAIGDFTGNGTDDILWYNVGSHDVAEWEVSNGQTTGGIDFGSAAPGLEIAGAGKFFGANAPSSVLWFNPNTGETDIWQMSNGNFAGVVNVGSIPVGYQVAGIGDFNGNGTDDILWYNPTSHDVAEWLIQGGHWAGSIDLGIAPSGWQPSGTGDFTHSGTSSVLVTQHV